MTLWRRVTEWRLRGFTDFVVFTIILTLVGLVAYYVIFGYLGTATPAGALGVATGSIAGGVLGSLAFGKKRTKENTQ